MATRDVQMPLIPLTDAQWRERAGELAHMHLELEAMEERHADAKEIMKAEAKELRRRMKRCAFAVRQQGEPSEG